MSAASTLQKYCQILETRLRLPVSSAPNASGAEGSPFEILLAVLVGRGGVVKLKRALGAAPGGMAPGTSGGMSPAMLLRPGAEALAEALRLAGVSPLKRGVVLKALAWLSDRARAETELAELAELADPALSFLAGTSTEALRAELLSIRGIGPESADSILLYALNRPVFVAGMHTYRPLHRHAFVGEETSYDEMNDLFRAALPEDASVYKRCDALWRELAAKFCTKAAPHCQTCPLGAFMEYFPD